MSHLAKHDSLDVRVHFLVPGDFCEFLRIMCPGLLFDEVIVIFQLHWTPDFIVIVPAAHLTFRRVIPLETLTHVEPVVAQKYVPLLLI